MPMTWLPRCIVLAMVLAAPVAASDIQVLGLFKDLVVVRIDGQQHKLRAGQSSPGGVKLVHADSDAAILEIDGEQRRFELGTHISTDFVPARQVEVSLWQNGAGMFTTVGSINGMPVDFLVDTGATSIAMNAREARRLGIDFRVVGSPGMATTASGVERIHRVRLKTVKVGDIQLRDIEAVVLEGGLPQDVLLGMSFLGQLDMQRQGHQLILRKKY